MKISKKRTCNGCKALSIQQYYSTCLLRYKFKSFIPQSPCPKPCTNNDYIFAYKNYQLKET